MAAKCRAHRPTISVADRAGCCEPPPPTPELPGFGSRPGHSPYRRAGRHLRGSRRTSIPVYGSFAQVRRTHRSRRSRCPATRRRRPWSAPATAPPGCPASQCPPARAASAGCRRDWQCAAAPRPRRSRASGPDRARTGCRRGRRYRPRGCRRAGLGDPDSREYVRCSAGLPTPRRGCRRCRCASRCRS